LGKLGQKSAKNFRAPLLPMVIRRRAAYCSWMGGEPADFKLKLEFRMLVGGNSDIPYRSVSQPGRGPSPYDVGGYQYDFDFAGNYPGNLYENGMAANAPAGTGNRGIISYKGQVVHLLPDAKRETIGCVGDATDLKGVMNINGWNYIHIMARGPVLLHLLNGRLITATIDDDPVRRKTNGRIAVQMEGLGEVHFRNIWLKNW